MATKEPILETDIIVTLPNIKDDAIYDLKCYDGYATGERICDTENAPKNIRLEYPTLEEVLADEEKVSYVLEYRGLYDLTPNDIHYGDIMMAYGEVVNN